MCFCCSTIDAMLYAYLPMMYPRSESPQQLQGLDNAVPTALLLHTTLIDNCSNGFFGTQKKARRGEDRLPKDWSSNNMGYMK